MKILSTQREHVRDRVFPLRISQKEKEHLRNTAKKEKRSIADIIRRGDLAKMREYHSTL